MLDGYTLSRRDYRRQCNQSAVRIDHQRAGPFVEMTCDGFTRDNNRDAQDKALAAATF
jgi:hypothetical protein